MNIAAPTTVPVAPQSTPSDDTVIVRAGDTETQRNFSLVNMMITLPGAEYVKYRSVDPSKKTAGFVNPAFVKLADAVLEDTYRGQELLYESEGTLPEPPDAGLGKGPWWERRVHMIKTIAALPGVHDWQFAGPKSIMFHTANETARDALDELVVDNLPDPRNTSVHFVVSLTGPEPNEADEPGDTA